ncbi:MAG: IS1634 family transposase, partial [Oscillospiraceae bacterium]|nr:IS1634 family transposase [Oscillospiraceae bacterium]
MVENNRTALGGISQRSIMGVGFMDDVNTSELHLIADGLTDLISGRRRLIEDSPKVQRYIDHIYSRLLKEKRIDRALDARKRFSACDWQQIDLNSLENKDVRELGADWLCLQTIRRLGIDSYLEKRAWSDHDRDLALAHIVCRTVYPASELKTLRYMQENSSIGELLGLDVHEITKDQLYGISHRLYAEKNGLESYLSRKTSELFALEDKIIIYDLTNSYYEGAMRKSSLARHGRSKEKRNDCPLVVLALVVNVEGFVKYSAIYEGNTADCTTLSAMIDKLVSSSITPPATADGKKRIVVIDAGISTEENLKMIVKKGFDYVCVSRSSMKKYTVAEGVSSVVVLDHRERPIELVEVKTPKSTDRDYYLKVSSPAKALKESSMGNRFCTRYEQELASIVKGITSKGGIKKYDAVNRRIGRMSQKYPSAHQLYSISLQKDENDICTSMTYEKKAQASIDKKKSYGVYFLHTSIDEPNENLVWTTYNCIREIESSIRCIKSDLDLRPIFHKTDDASKAHIHLGLMAYWIVNTVRYQLKDKGVTSDWRELVRVMNTQKCVTTTMTDDKGQRLSVRCCSKPEPKIALLYDALKMKQAPFIRKKSVVLKINSNEINKADYQID